MKRTLPLLMFGFAALVGLTFAAETPVGRQIYSSRQPGAPRRPVLVYDEQPVIVEQETPRLAPQPFWQPSKTVISEGPAFVQPGPVAAPDPNLPLSGIDFPAPPSPKKNEEPKPTPNLEFPARTPIAFPPSNTQIDEFYARLAKLQLEKKQLTETLTLIGKIKSDSFKVKTLVELAEYVAHDGNYQREADQLFVLAQNGIDALANGKPISIDVLQEERKTVPSHPAEEKASPRRPALLDEPDEPKPTPRSPMLLDDDEPVAEERKPVPAPKRPMLLGDDDEPVVEPTPQEAEQPARQPTRRAMPTRRMLLDDE